MKPTHDQASTVDSNGEKNDPQGKIMKNNMLNTVSEFQTL